MIQLCNVTTLYRQTATITFDLLPTVVIEKACYEWNCVINSETSIKEELLREEELVKRDRSVNQDTKNDELDENKYRSGDDLPYTPTVEKTSS